MDKKFDLKPPIFGIGPKAYLYGRDILELAKVADRVSKKYGIQTMISPQYTDIPIIARETKNLLVFAQHMDPLRPGRGVGSVLPEALKAAGAFGVMLNHCEKPLSFSNLSRAIKRAAEVGLATIVCADSIGDAEIIARFSPDMIVVEEPDVIASGKIGSSDFIKAAKKAVQAIAPDIIVLYGAGVNTGEDVYKIMKNGADGTGGSSGICAAEDPATVVEEMVRAMRKVKDELQNKI